jgi:hypothetical protein
MASPLSQALGFEKSCVVDVAVSLSHESGWHVVSIGDGLLSQDYWQQFSKVSSSPKACVFLATLVAAYPGSAVN